MNLFGTEESDNNEDEMIDPRKLELFDKASAYVSYGVCAFGAILIIIHLIIAAITGAFAI